MKNQATRYAPIPQAGRGRNVSTRLMVFEALEDRRLMSLVAWDGGGDGVKWSDAANWTNDTRPAVNDDVTIPQGVAGVVIDASAGSVQIKSLSTKSSLSVKTGGTLIVTSLFEVYAGLTLDQGTIKDSKIIGKDGAVLTPTSAAGTLDGVTLNIDMNMTSGARVNVVNGLELNSTVRFTAAQSTPSAHITFGGPGSGVPAGTILGNGVLDFQGLGGGWLLNYSTLAGNAGALTIGPGITILNNGTGNIASWYEATGQALIQGPIIANSNGNNLNIGDGSGGAIVITNGVKAIGGSNLNFRRPVELSGNATFASTLDSTILLRGGLTGDITNPAAFTPAGKTWISSRTEAGIYNATLEVMSQDRGAVSDGFKSNFAFGTIQVDVGNTLTLIDAHNNARGDDPEAVYTNVLIVPSGSKIDLNGLNLYTRHLQLSGTVINGTVTVIPDSGPIALSVPAAGSISSYGEVDEWTFSGVSGQSVTLKINTSSVVADSVPGVYLGMNTVRLELIGPNGVVLAETSKNAALVSLSLTDIPLPATGGYRVRVSGHASSVFTKGNYQLLVSTGDTDRQPLELNQQIVSAIDLANTSDEWYFNVNQDTPIQLDVIPDLLSAGIAKFTLKDPAGGTVFSNLTTDSAVISAPGTGRYTLSVTATGNNSGSYRFVVRTGPQAQLQANIPITGTHQGLASVQYFSFQKPDDSPFFLQVDDQNSSVVNRIFVKRGAVPTQTDYDAASPSPGEADPFLLVNDALAGEWFVMVYADAPVGGSSYSLTMTPVTGLFVNPISTINQRSDMTLNFNLKGTGFIPGTSVRLVSPTGTVYEADLVEFSSLTGVAVTFSGSRGIPAGVYDIQVVSPAGQTRTLTDIVTLTTTGQGQLFSRLILPAQMGRTATATIYVEYMNVGNAPMPAPVLIVKSSDADNSDRPMFTVDASRMAENYWAITDTGEFPAGVSNEVFILASGAQPGILRPGEHVKVPIYYLGLQKPWDLSDTSIEIDLTVWSPDDDRPIDLSLQKDSLRPRSVSEQAWEPIFASLNSGLNTIGDYVKMLSENASYLGQLGITVRDIDTLWGFEVQQAIGLSPVENLANAIDAILPVPGPALAVARSFTGSITSRYVQGVFGQGWFSPWETRFEKVGNNQVVIIGNQGMRNFYLDTRDGSYFSPTGDADRLVRVLGYYRLIQPDGSFTQFRADGQVDFVQDSRGNRVTAGYDANDRWNKLSHVNGQSISLTYNAGGKVSSISDTSGRVTTYTYDPSGKYLLAVTAGQDVTRYTYDTSTDPAKTHTLVAVETAWADGIASSALSRTLVSGDRAGFNFLPGSIVNYFEYDASGRLSAKWTGDNINRLAFGYQAGMFSITDALGTSRAYYDHRGLRIKSVDALGFQMAASYDSALRLENVINSAGEILKYKWADDGTMTHFTDANGNTTRFHYEPVFKKLNLLTDANGNTTQYYYDLAGNLTAKKYADDTVERFTFGDAQGLLTTYENRRGQETQYTRNALGLITRRTFDDGSIITYTYDARGRLLSANQDGKNTLYLYDSGDRLTQITDPNGRSLTYTYNPMGRRTSIEDSDGNITRYEYDPVNRLAAVRNESGSLIAGYTYAASGKISRVNKGNGTFTTYGYDNLGRVTQVANHGTTGTVSSSFNYTYDIASRIVRTDSLDGFWVYQYNRGGEMTRASFTGTKPGLTDHDYQYSYDANGNRIQSIVDGVTTNYTVNELNQYSAVNGVNYQYDADGNLLFDGLNSYAYDTQGRLMEVNGPDGHFEYEYDAFGHRIASTANGVRTEFLYDLTGGVNIIGEYDDADNLTALNTHGIGLVSRQSAGTTNYFDFDLTGSTVAITSSVGLALNNYIYDPFGAVIHSNQAVANAFKYVGEFGVRSEAGGQLLEMGARDYSPRLGRFTTADPAGLGGEDYNFYRYVQNNPVSQIDPTGLWYVNIGLSGGNVGGVTGGYLIGSTGIYSYAGVGVTTPGLGGSVTYSQQDPSTGLSLQAQGALGEGEVGGAVSYSKDFDSLGNGSLTEGGSVEAGVGFGLGGSKVTGAGLFSTYTWKVLPFDFDEWFRDNEDVYGGKDAKDHQSGKPGNPGNSHPPTPGPGFPPGWPSDGYGDDSEVPSAIDPNEILGAAGYGPEAFIPASSIIPYRINFENLGPGSLDSNGEPYREVATAPAQRVTITDPLPSTLDWTTLRFTEFGFGDTIVALTGEERQFNQTVSLTIAGVTFNVQVRGSIDLETGTVFVSFQSLDPETGLPPEVLVGFLPPEDGKGAGKGHVGFTILPKAELTTGTEIRNIGVISFDNQMLIATNQVDPLDASAGTDPNKEALNTIDSGTPTSQIVTLPGVTGALSFNVTWAGHDDAKGSGIADYDIYASTDKGPWQLWLADTKSTSATFTGENGRSYSFYSVAQDNVGNRELPPTLPDASTTVSFVVAPPFAETVLTSKSTIAQRTYIDSNGNKVTLNLTGPGTLVLQRPDQTKADAIGYKLSGTSSATALTVQVTKASKGTVDSTSVGSIEVDGPLSTLSAAKFNLMGDLSIDGTIKTLTLNDVIGTGQETITIGGATTNKTTMTFGRLSDVSIQTPATITAFKALEWQDLNDTPDTIKAFSLGSFTISGKAAARAGTTTIPAIAGNMHADITLTQTTFTKTSPVFTSFAIAGGVSADLDLGVHKLNTATLKSNASGNWSSDTGFGAINIAGSATDLNIQSSRDIGAITIKGQANDVMIQASANIGAITSANWLGGSISANKVTSISTKGIVGSKSVSTIPGNFTGIVDIAGSGLSTRTTSSLGMMNIAGQLFESQIQVGGKLGAVTVGSADNANFDVTADMTSFTSKGQVHDTSLNISGGGGAINALNWLGGSINASKVATISTKGTSAIPGHFSADVNITASGLTSKTSALNSASIAGTLTGIWSILGKSGAITVGSTDNAKIDVIADLTSFTSKGQAKDTVLNIGANVGAINSLNWLGGSITADKITSVTTKGQAAGRGLPAIPGDFSGQVNVTGQGVTSKATALGNVTIAGTLINSQWSIDGNVGNVTVGAAINSSLFAGVNPLVDPTGLPTGKVQFTNASAILQAFTVTGKAVANPNTTPSFVNTRVAAGVLTKVSLKRVDLDEPLENGFVAASKIGSYSRQTGPSPANTFKLTPSNQTAPGVYDPTGGAAVTGYRLQIVG